MIYHLHSKVTKLWNLNKTVRKIQLSDCSDNAGRQQIFPLLFLGKANRKVDQLMQIHVADDFIAEDVVQ